MTPRLSRLLLVGTPCLMLGLIGVRVSPRDRAGDASPRVAELEPTFSDLALQVLPITPPVQRQTAFVHPGPSRDAVMPTALTWSHRLRLLGTVLGAHPVAFIQDTTAGRSRRYALHDSIASTSTTVEEIQRGSVRLRTEQGRHLVLLLDSIRAAETPDQATGDPAIQVGRQTAQVSVHVRPRLSQTDGTFQGLAIETLEPSEVAHRLDLQPGDLVQAINGQRLLTPAQSLQVFKKAWRQPELSVELQRHEELLVRTLTRQ